MSLNRDKEYIPVSIRIPAEESPFWGRLLSISPDGMRLLSQFPFKQGKTLILSFEFSGEKLENIRAKVTTILQDPSGYYHYSLALTDQNHQKNLITKLLRAAADNNRR